MDSLRELINSKKADLKKRLDNRNWIPYSDIQKYEKQDYLNRQKERDLKKVLKGNNKSSSINLSKENVESVKKDEGITNKKEGAGGNGSEPVFTSKNNTEPDNSSLKREAIKRLRQMGEPITLFGEDDQERYKRLRQLEIKGRTNEEMNIGQQNIFVHGFDPNISLYSVSQGQVEVEIYEELEEIDGESHQKFILRWIEAQLIEWEKLLKSRKKADSETEKGRQDSARYYQTKRDIQPLVSSLNTLDGKVDKDVMEKLHEIVVLCNRRDYIKAQDKYIELAIGNAPWPMGVTMVGIHERAGRTKIFSSHIAHVLNDETTRKYIQMFKRLITHCESKRPPRNSQKKESLEQEHSE
ncbi:pre-mRNA splicing factor protein [Cryptosporidium felis]|nr:pre-mRNA splicing factor protein [Cryptosporidium felis]